MRFALLVLALTVVVFMPAQLEASSCTAKTYYIEDGNCYYEGIDSWGCNVATYYCGGGLLHAARDVSTCALNCTWNGCYDGFSTEASSCTPSPETCGSPNGDVNCNGTINEDCAPCKTPFASGGQSQAEDNCCQNKAGSDPILLGSRAAATEPYTDFSVDRVSRLSLTRTYNSSDYDLTVSGTGGPFGNAWHHDWEGYVTCSSSTSCRVMRGTLQGFAFTFSGYYVSLDGTETWSVFLPDSSTYKATHHHVLVSRPSGEWILYQSDGRELHFEQVCTSCDSSSSAFCTAVLSGGRARLVKVVDPTGNGVTVSYDPANKTLLKLTDDLGHALTLTSATSCPSPAYANALTYDGVTVASYTTTSNHLNAVTDLDGKTLRSYTYSSIGLSWPRLKAVLNQAGTAIAEFLYNSTGYAIGVVDSSSSVEVSYANNGAKIATTVLEYYRGPWGDTASSSVREFDYRGHVTHTDDGCSCGPANTTTWTEDGHPSCTIDSEGHVTYQEFDALGRVTHRVEYAGESCTLPATLPADAREEWRTYGETRILTEGAVDAGAIGDGGTDGGGSAFDGGAVVALDAVTKVTQHSGVQTSAFTEETYDYSQASANGDPSGYSCASTALPAGSVVCREIVSGYVPGSSGAVLERHATYNSYDARGRLIRRYGPIDLDQPGANDVPPIEERAYWSDGESSARQGRLHQVKRYPSASASPLVTTYDYDAFGVSSTVEPDGAQTAIAKDSRGRPTVVTQSDRSGTAQATTETRYYDELTPRLRILASGAAERYSYDSKGRLVKTEYLSSDPEASGSSATLGWSELYAYDQAGNRIHAERRNGAGTVTWQQDRAYDVRHHVVWESNPSLPSASRSWTYTASGFLSATQDEEGRAVSYTPDGLNRVQKITRSGVDGTGNATALDVATYAYGSYRDALSSVLDGDGHATSYVYDDFGRVAKVSSPTLSRGGGVWYTYDARGNVVGRGDSSVTVTYTYDGLDRLLTVNGVNSTDSSSVSYQYTYDEGVYTGRLTSIIEPERTVSFTYDWAGRLATEVVTESGVSVPFTTSYGYNAAGELQQIAYPSGLTIVLARDPASREVVSVKSSDGTTTFASNVTHVPGGAISGLTFGNGRTLSQTFDLRYSPLTIASGPLKLSYGATPSGDVGVELDESEDPSGCVKSRTRSFAYDFLDRLSSWNDAQQSSASGTCSLETLGSMAGAFTYVTGTDQIASQWSPSASGVLKYAFGYDIQGNISAVGQYDSTGTSLSQAVCLRHDALGRLVLAGYTSSSFSPGATICTTDAEVTTALARFKYDARNRRIARQVDGTWTYIISDASGNPLSEFTKTSGSTNPWAKVRDYVWLDGKLLAQVEYVGTAGTAYVYYAHVDHLGTPHALTNPSGEQVWSTYQRPYGEVGEKTVTDTLSGQTVATNLRLPGQYDERVFAKAGIDMQGPYYNWNRWYLPSVGRYLEADPVALQGHFNTEHRPDWYDYADGNPILYTDPLGLDRNSACENPRLGWLGRWICKKGVKRTCEQMYGREHCCNADLDDCRNKKEYGCDGWEKHMAECQEKWSQCMKGGD